MDKISVIIPVYNTGRYLERCIYSVLEQTYDNLEIILINDGSTDNSQIIIDRFVNQFPDKVVALFQHNSGQSAARNNGLKHVTGKYIFFLDSDDWLQKNLFRLLYDKIKTCDDDICVCNINFYYDESPKPSDFISIFRINKYLPQKFCWGKLIKNSYWSNNEFKFIEGIFYEDLELVPKILFNTSRISIVDVPLYNYELRNQTSTTKTKKKDKYIFLIMQNLIEFYLNKQRDYLYEQFLLSSIILLFLESYESKDNNKFKTLFDKYNRVITLANTLNINQKLIVVMYKLGIPLKIIHNIVKVRKYLIGYVRGIIH